MYQKCMKSLLKTSSFIIMHQKIHGIVVEVWESILCGVVAIILEKVMFMVVLARLP